MKKILKTAAGAGLVTAGVAGLALPVIPGWLLIAAGVSLISPPLAGRLRQQILSRLPSRGLLKADKIFPKRIVAFMTTRRADCFLRHSDELGDLDKQMKLVRVLKQNRLPIPKRFVYLNQVHGSRAGVIESNEPRYFESRFVRLAKTDAVITNAPDVGLVALTADCLGIFFQAGHWVGLAHAGWRGTREGIAGKTLEAICARSGAAPDDVRIYFGPCIRSCHYEVGPEFKQYFRGESLSDEGGRLTFNLPLENRRQLLEAGVSEARIHDSGICTVCRNDDFYSHRAEGGSAGRMLSIIFRE